VKLEHEINPDPLKFATWFSFVGNWPIAHPPDHLSWDRIYFVFPSKVFKIDIVEVLIQKFACKKQGFEKLKLR
jgi:hypothetical protein